MKKKCKDHKIEKLEKAKKHKIEKLEKAKKYKNQLINKLKMLAKIEEGNGWEYFVVIDEWVKYGKDRTYLKVVKTRKNSSGYAVIDCGYYDNVKKKYVSGIHDITSNYTLGGMKL